MLDIAIVGGGPAGMAAALYGARARARTVVFEKGLPGGQIVTTEWVENYPAFPEGISGSDLGELMLKQAERFGAEFRTFSPVESIRTEGTDFVLTVDGEEIGARAVIVATGAVPKKLGVPGEAEFTGRGVSWCATCDGAFFRDKAVCVVGGGDAALQEALFLTKFATTVSVVHRRDQLRATECIQEYCFQNEKIDVRWSRVVSEIVGEGGKVKGVRLASTKGEPDEFLPLDGVFIFVGVDPVNELLLDFAGLDEFGFVTVDNSGLTSVPGLWAAGDLTANTLKQVVTAASGGASAAFDALRYIEAKTCGI
ncbi:MAG: thioredoxin-disulfide reductase [Actinobacteria bacterium]|nr:thioredoxin-disulfide reductase [Actinomycetota bacterium]